jgi:hypothetical protein
MCLPLMCLIGYCCCRCRGKDPYPRNQYMVPSSESGYGYQQSGQCSNPNQYISYQNQTTGQQQQQSGYNIIPQPGYPPAPPQIEFNQ